MSTEPVFRIGTLSSKATKFVERADPKTQTNLQRHLEQIACEPFGTAKHLKGRVLCNRQDEFGAFRIEFTVNNDQKVIDILTIAPRKDRWRRSAS